MCFPYVIDCNPTPDLSISIINLPNSNSRKNLGVLVSVVGYWGLLSLVSKQDFTYKTVSDTFLDILSVKGKRSRSGIGNKYA